VAGGEGRGLNGGPLLALALGGCFSTDMQFTAEDMNEPVSSLQIDVSLELAGDPTVVTSATISTDCLLASDADPAPLLERARARCTVANSLRAGA
jgi:organic hydroperoxide reductase OsmC/OhrA